MRLILLILGPLLVATPAYAGVICTVAGTTETISIFRDGSGAYFEFSGKLQGEESFESVTFAKNTKSTLLIDGKTFEYLKYVYESVETIVILVQLDGETEGELTRIKSGQKKELVKCTVKQDFAGKE